MRTRKVIALSLLSGAAVLFSGCPAQPPGPCVIARTGGGGAEGIGSPYLVKYYLNDGGSTGDCTTNPAIAPFGGEFVGVLFAEAYGPVTAIDKITGMIPEEFGYTGGYTGDYVQGSPNSTPPVTNNPVILGAFTTDTEDVNNTCTVKGSAPGVQLINGVTVSYNYSNVLVYTAAAAGEGTQIQAAVTITRDDGVGPACVNNYTAIGLWPSTLCNVNNDCNPNPQPQSNRALGSGILTGIPVECNLTLAAEDPIFVTGAMFLADCGCGDGVTPAQYVLQTGACCGGAHDNNGTNGTSLCFFTNPSPTAFPYLGNFTP